MVSKELICVAGIFLFSKSWRLVSPSGTFLGEIIGLCCRTGLSAVFSSCCVAALQACETSRLGPPSRIADPGLFWAIFQVGPFPEELFCVVRINCFRDFLPVTVLVTVDGNSRVVFARSGGDTGQVRVLSGRRLERRGS